MRGTVKRAPLQGKDKNGTKRGKGRARCLNSGRQRIGAC